MKKYACKLLKIMFLISFIFTNIFNTTSVFALESIKSMMDDNDIEKVYSDEFTSEEDAINARGNEILNQEAIKAKKAEEGIEYLYFVSELEKRTKTVPTTVEDFKEEIKEFVSSDVISTSEALREAEEELINSYKVLNDDNNIYSVTITFEDKSQVSVGVGFNKVNYDTLDLALEAIGNRDLEYTRVYDETENKDEKVDMECNGIVDCEEEIDKLTSNSDLINVSVKPIKVETPGGEKEISLEDY